VTGKALDGLRIVEFCDEAGSYCGRLLADLGAEVIKVEPPGGGRERHTPPFYRDADNPDTSIAFWVHNTSKKSVTLDLDTEEGQRLARELIFASDAVIEDFPVGYLSERGLGYADFEGKHLSLVYTSITGFGQEGPHAGYAYSDIVGQAMGGIMTLAGDPEDQPNTIYGNQSNVSASLHAAVGTLVAVLEAEAHGAGQRVDVSAQDATSMSMETAMMTWDLQKRNRVRLGDRGLLPVRIPASGIYETADGYCMLFVTAPAGADFPDLVDWMDEQGMAGDLKDEPYASLTANLNMRMLTQVMVDPESARDVLPQLEHIHAQVAAFCKSLSSRELYEEGQRRLLLIGICSTPKDLAENTQLRARDWFTKLEFEFLDGTLEFPGPPYRLSESPAEIRRPPRLGEHNDQILGALSPRSQEAAHG
jgi:crotonobetainyl-CoA:carnitine CoA-transferase CaiB-like acyl-CoA transferase